MFPTPQVAEDTGNHSSGINSVENGRSRVESGRFGVFLLRMQFRAKRPARNLIDLAYRVRSVRLPSKTYATTSSYDWMGGGEPADVLEVLKQDMAVAERCGAKFNFDKMRLYVVGGDDLV